MTRNADLDLEDLRECSHEPETPVMKDGQIVEWLCRCGRSVAGPKEEGNDER